MRATREVVYGTGTIAIRAEEEYAYVARDLSRFARTAALMLVMLFGLWILIDVTKIIPIG